jgi:hypothetical protein
MMRRSVHRITVNGVLFDGLALEAFLRDLYDNVGTPPPQDFNPVDEVIRVVTILREQGKNESINRSTQD